jgi:hypothetical protein
MKTKLLLILTLFSFSQLAYSQRIGIKGGINIANLEFPSGYNLGQNIASDNFNLIHVGFVCENKILGGLHFNSGLFYTEKGYRENFTGNNGEKTLLGWDKYQYFEIPFNLELKALLKNKTSLFIQAGPYGGYAFAGKSYWYGESGSIDYDRSGLNRYDYGLGFGGGIELGDLVLSVNYQKGFANLSKDSGLEIKNKVLQFSIAIMGNTH